MVVPEDNFRAKMRHTASAGILSAVLQKTQVRDKAPSNAQANDRGVPDCVHASTAIC